MKRWVWLLVLTAATAPGCVTVPNKIEEPPVPPVEMSELTPPPPVTPEQVNEGNVREMFQRVNEEVERERNALPPSQR